MKYLLIMYILWGQEQPPRVTADRMPDLQTCEAVGRSFAGQIINNEAYSRGYVCVKIGRNQ